MPKTTHSHPSLLLDLLIIAIGVGLVFSASRFGLETGHPATKGAGAVLCGLYIIYLGALFLLSYFFSGACHVFSLLAFVCEACSQPAGRHMALLYCGLCLLVGSSLLLIGLGVL
jgi:hypothetical protein